VFGDVLAGVRDILDPTETATDRDAVGDEPDVNNGQARADVVPAGVEPMGSVAERAGRMVLRTLADAGGVAELSGAHEAVSAHHGNNHTPLMERYYRSHRSTLFALLEVLELESTSTDNRVLEAVAVLQANRARIGEYVPDHHQGRPIDLSFAGQLWHDTLRSGRRPGRLPRRHFEVCVFGHLAAELRTGDIAVIGAESYANLHTQLMSWAECGPLVAEYCAQVGLPATAADAVATWKQQLSGLALTVDAGYPDNADLVIDAGRPVLKRRTGTDRRASALALETAIHQRLPERGLLDILTRTAYQIGWSRHFGPPSGSDPKLRDALGRYVATAFCYGTYLGPAQLARHMPGQVSARELARAFHQHAGQDRLAAAQTDVINAVARLDITRLWGDGSVVAADGSHRSPQSTQFYAKISPTTLNRAYDDAGYFSRNMRTIEVLSDRDAITSGAAAAGEPWQHYDLGHGYCTYTFFEQCPHRMACARCGFFRIRSPCCSRSCCERTGRVWRASGSCSGSALMCRPARSGMGLAGGPILSSVNASWGSGSGSRSWSHQRGGWTRG
jgi:hypothetical protein